MEFIVWHIKGIRHGVAKILGLESQEIVVKTQFLSIIFCLLHIGYPALPESMYKSTNLTSRGSTESSNQNLGQFG